MTGLATGDTVTAIDPGRDKCGVAVLDESGAVLDRFVVRTDSFVGALRHCLEEYPHSHVIVGDGTTSEALQARIADELPDLTFDLVPEQHTTERALELWRDVEPARGWRRLLPRSLRFPRRPIDDFAAWVLATDYLSDRNARDPRK